MSFLKLFGRGSKGNVEYTAYDFSRDFGFVPPEKTEIAMYQPTVDAFLRLRAEAYNKACKKQESLMHEDVSSYSEGRLTQHGLEIHEAARDITREKKGFWHPHGAAKAAGFSVRPNYTDYLEKKPTVRVLEEKGPSLPRVRVVN